VRFGNQETTALVGATPDQIVVVIADSGRVREHHVQRVRIEPGGGEEGQDVPFDQRVQIRPAELERIRSDRQFRQAVPPDEHSFLGTAGSAAVQRGHPKLCPVRAIRPPEHDEFKRACVVELVDVAAAGRTRSLGSLRSHNDAAVVRFDLEPRAMTPLTVSVFVNSVLFKPGGRSVKSNVTADAATGSANATIMITLRTSSPSQDVGADVSNRRSPNES
jgi:hypothetical protein